MRAAILPLPGDPILFTYWMKFFDSVWGSEVNHLYIYHNSPAEKDVVDYINSFASDKVTIIFEPNFVDHGECIRRTLEVVKEEHVLLIEDDGYIFKPGKVDRCFSVIERDLVDVVAGKRASCHEEIVKAAHNLFNTGAEPNLWPNFLFCKTDDLKKAGDNYCSKAWKKGEVIEPLNYTVKNEVIYSDTFVEASLKMRAMGLRVHLEDQYHGMTDDEPDHKAGRNVWSAYCHWTHCGSLSSGFNGVLVDDYLRPLAKRHTMPPQDTFPNYCHTENERLEFERRVSFWIMGLEHTKTVYNAKVISDFINEYDKALNRLMRAYKLNKTRIKNRINWYREVGL